MATYFYGIWFEEVQKWAKDGDGNILWYPDKSLAHATLISTTFWDVQRGQVRAIGEDGLPIPETPIESGEGDTMDEEL